MFMGDCSPRAGAFVNNPGAEKFSAGILLGGLEYCCAVTPAY